MKYIFYILFALLGHLGFSQGSGNALDFDGSNDHVLISDNSALDIQDEITIEFWFLLEGNGSTNTFPRAISKGQTNTSNGAYGIFIKDISDPDDIGFRFIDASGTSRTIRSSSVPNYNDGQWHHVAATYSNSNDEGILYVDGLIEATVSITGNTQIRSTNDDLTIGAGLSNRFFNGQIDDVRIWNVARTRQEIREFMCAKLSGTETNLVGYWNFDNAATGSGNIEDLTSNNLDGTMTNMDAADILTSAAPIGDESIHSYPQDWSGNALDFDGSDDYVDIGDVLVDGTGAITVEAWIYPTALRTNGSPSGHNSNEGAVIHKNGGSDDNLGLTVSTGGIAFYVDNGSNNTLRGSAPSINTWTHVAATYDGSDLTIYVNGVQDATQASIGSGNFVNNTNSLRIGGGHIAGGSPHEFTGRIDEVRVWNYARTANEITNDMCRPLEGNETGLTGYWRFDEFTGITTAADATGSNNGSLTNMDASTDWLVADHSCSLTGFELFMTSPDNDSLGISSFTGNPDGVHIYYVNEAPNSISGTQGLGSNNIYYGVWTVEGSSPTYSATYYYAENDSWQNPDAALDENDLLIFSRDENASLTWSNLGATLNTSRNTLLSTSNNSSEFILGISEGALPVELIDFSVYQENKSVNIKWSTITEINNDFFEVLKTSNGETWEKVIQTKGAGNSSKRIDYEAVDKYPNHGTSYYKLKQVDFDGTVSYSEPQSVNFKSKANLSFYPNPSNDFIRIISDNNISNTFQFLNSLGQDLSSKIKIIRQSKYQLILDLQLIPGGSYVIKLGSEYHNILKIGD